MKLNRNILVGLLVTVNAGLLLVPRALEADAGRWPLILFGAWSVIAIQTVLVMLVEVLGSTRISRLAQLLGHYGSVSIVALLILLAASSVYLFAQMSWNAGWVGIAVPLAVSIPAITIFVVTGGWDTFRRNFLTSDKEK
jgi:hypothetical protein